MNDLNEWITEVTVSKSKWYQWVKAKYAISKATPPDTWQLEIELEFKKLLPNLVSIKWVD